MRDKNTVEQTKKAKKQESVLITKESVSAVCALFFFLVFLITCTDSIIFGEIGRLTQDFFLGVFGYFSYPLLLGGLYLSVAVFLDKRWVKNRVAFFSACAAVITLLLVLQAAFTYSWALEGYAKACFSAGEKFVTATLLGWVGGCLLSAVFSLVGKIGALILFSVLCLAFLYATVIFSGKKLTKKADKPSKVKKSKEKTVTEINLAEQNATNGGYEGQNNVYPPMQRESFSGSSYSYAPKPSVIINENDYYNNQSRTPANGFSPFSGYKQPPQAEAVGNQSSLPVDAEDRRQFLLGSSPAEIYQKNLIFDSNASVNKRKEATTDQPSYRDASSTSFGTQSGFSSYTEAYENSLNERKPVASRYEESSDRATSTFEATRQDRVSYLNVEKENADSTSNTNPFASERTEYGNDRSYSSQQTERNVEIQPASHENEREVPSANDRENSNENYRRHNYMDYFSLSNPNIFGQNDRGTDGERGFGRREERTEFSSLDRQSDASTSPTNAFTRREESSDFLNTDRTLSNDRTLDSGVSRMQTSESQETRFEEESTNALNIFDDDQVVESEVFKTTEEPQRRMGFTDRTSDRSLESVPFRRETPTQTERVVEQKAEEIPQKKPKIYRPYVPAPLHYFDCSDVVPDADPLEIEEAKTEILNVYNRNGFTGIEIQSVVFGPTLTRYNLSFDMAVSSNKLVNKEIEAAMSLALRVKNGVNMYINYEDRQICIETPNKKRQTVQLGCMLTGSKYTDAKSGSLVFAIGKDIVNRKLYGDVSEMVHMLVAGSTGSGKSVFLNTLIISLINRYSPEELRLILIDPKRTEFVIYNDLPHLMINEIINDPRKAIQSFNWAIGEMNRRYDLFAQMSKRGKLVRNLDEYNAALTAQEEKLPKIVIVVDELADLMLASKKEVEERIQNITQKSRAAGIHMIIATQRPSVDVITGVIKANLATRFAFMVASDIDSRVILDASGAQKLLGYGDMLYGKVGSNPVRAQCAFISSSDCQKVVDFIKENNEAYFDETATSYINNSGSHAPVGDEDGGEALVEEVYIEALKLVILSNTASISMIQRKCSVGYNKAGKIVEWMEDMGYISPYDGAKARKVLISKEEFEELYGEM